MEFTHIANPVRVTATKILEVAVLSEPEAPAPDLLLRLADGRIYTAYAFMTARHVPVAGDYLVRQEDGYEYLTPKDVFERKYRSLDADPLPESDPPAANMAIASYTPTPEQHAENRRYSALQLAAQTINPGDYERMLEAAKAYELYLAGAPGAETTTH